MSMPRMSGAVAAADEARWSAWSQALLLIGALTLLRAVLLFFAGHELYGDEAQYWSYAVEPAFGYYSKPPMVAWAIQVTTLLCGDGEACVRLSSPLLHGATALLVFAVARQLFDTRVGLWSAGVYATLPAVSYSSLLVSTDVPLLAFWTLGLLAVLRLRAAQAAGTGAAGWVLALAAAFGFGLLSKYAMAYMVLCLAVYAAIDRDGRRLLADRRLWAALALGLVIWSPNLWWNLQHGGATLLHISENANVGTEYWQPFEGLGFVGSQFGIMGPILFAALLIRLAVLPLRPAAAGERLLLAFSVPMLAVILVQAFLAGANANWAATAYPAATILVVAWLLRGGWRLALNASLALHLAVLAGLAALALNPGGAPLPWGQRMMGEVSGWRALGQEVARRAAAAEAEVVLFDHRYPFGEVWYYSDLAPPRLRMWVTKDISNHYELKYPYPGGGGVARRVLYISDRPHPAQVPARFDHTLSHERFAVPTLGGRPRHYHAIVLDGFQGTPAPSAPAAAGR